MDVMGIRQHDSIGPLHVVLICLVAVTVGGGSLLLSAAESATLVDGAVEWHAESPLRALVQVLCLNYQFPTIHAGAVKIYMLGMGAGLSILAVSIAIAWRRRGDCDDLDGGDSIAAPAGDEEARGENEPDKVHLAPLVAAQALLALYLLWSFASVRWSAAPMLAVGGSVLLTIHILWAFGIGMGLNVPAARIASRMVIIIAGVTAVVALWYYYGRNPTLRAKFPFGNPNFLSACLIPGLLLAGTLACEKVMAAVGTKRGRPIGAALGALFVLVVGLWAFYLTGSRGPALGLWFGLLATAFFGLRGWLRALPPIVAVGTVVVGCVYFLSAKNEASSRGRDVTLRVRTYAWDYAWRMFEERPLTGFGQGGFVLAGDSYAVHDVQSDPRPFETRIAHAHSEWLEVMADLGSVGIVLVAAGLLLTLRAGVLALESLPSSGEYWAMLGLMGALVGLVVEEAFGVGLRVSGVGAVFYTVIGLIWALGAQRLGGVVARLSVTRRRRVLTGVVGGLVGLATLVLTHQDFASARCTYRAGESLAAGEYEEAISLATVARSRLNPQRALANLARRAEAHFRVAQRLQQRAFDRRYRARMQDLPDMHLLQLAEQDFKASDEQCGMGSAALRDLVSWSPGYFNHGWLESLLELTLARNADARGDAAGRDGYLSIAADAIQRELARQPFNPSISIQFAQIAAPAGDPEQRLMDVLARPLRHHAITKDHVDLLSQLAADPVLSSRLSSSVQEAKLVLASPPGVGPVDESKEVWAPEKLRLGATVYFLRGQYDRARENLELAAGAYDALAASAPIGAASCFAELADSRFFGKPDDPEAALNSARRAIELAPESLVGRRLRESASRRMVDYHLAADDEEAALDTLRGLEPPGAADGVVMQKLGLRYRRLCESLLQRRTAGVLRKPPREMLPKLRRWVARSIELNPDDPLAHFLATDLTFHADDAALATSHLRQALDLGLSIDAAIQFLQIALEKMPDSPELRALWAELRAGPSPERSEPGAPPSLRPSVP